jgi:hypothetical protein
MAWCSYGGLTFKYYQPLVSNAACIDAPGLLCQDGVPYFVAGEDIFSLTLFQ